MRCCNQRRTHGTLRAPSSFRLLFVFVILLGATSNSDALRSLKGHGLVWPNGLIGGRSIQEFRSHNVTKCTTDLNLSASDASVDHRLQRGKMGFMSLDREFNLLNLIAYHGSAIDITMGGLIASHFGAAYSAKWLNGNFVVPICDNALVVKLIKEGTCNKRMYETWVKGIRGCCLGQVAGVPRPLVGPVDKVLRGQAGNLKKAYIQGRTIGGYGEDGLRIEPEC